MTRLEQLFAGDKKAKFIPYFSLGDPDYEHSVKWAGALIEGGADIIELGIPFSDPVADGPVIQKAFKRAFNNPFSMETIFETTLKIHRLNTEIPLVYLTYFNPVSHYGIAKFFKKAASCGISGIIIPDLTYETNESGELYQEALKNGINLIQLVSPATPVERMEEMKKVSGGFVYYVTSFGVTGARTVFAGNIAARIKQVQKIYQLPVCAGFGISTPEHAKKFSQIADGVIIGSAIQKIIEEFQLDPVKCSNELLSYCNSVKNGME